MIGGSSRAVWPARPCAGYSDSLTHIFVSRELEHARWWCRRLASGNERQEDYVIYEIRAADSGLTLNRDSLSANTVTYGYTVDQGNTSRPSC